MCKVSDCAYINNEKVQPAPGVCEILGKSVCYPLQQHLQNKDVGKDFVCKLQHYFNGLPLFDVDVFECLNVGEMTKNCNCLTGYATYSFQKLAESRKLEEDIFPPTHSPVLHY